MENPRIYRERLMETKESQENWQSVVIHNKDRERLEESSCQDTMENVENYICAKIYTNVQGETEGD